MPAPVAAIVLAFGPDQAVERALASLRQQTVPADELIVVHDSADEGLPRRRVGASVTLVRVESRSPGGVRNAGVRQSRSDAFFIVDGSENPDSRFIESARAALEDEPSPGFVASPTGFAEGAAIDRARDETSGFSSATLAWLLASPFAVAAATLIRRTAYDSLGGFDESLPGLVEWDLLISLLESGRGGLVLPRAPATGYPDGLPPARHYRAERHLPAVRRIFLKHHPCFEQHAAAILTERERAARVLWDREHELLQRRERLRRELTSTVEEVNRLRAALRPHGRDTTEWGDLRRTSPVSRYWGLDRGRPVDRHYIEGFLARHAGDIRGAVLEVLDSGLTALGGDRVERSDVLDIDADNHRATVIADLRAADWIPSDSYDCFILTQTLHVIDDVRTALAHAYRILRPGGVLLATLPSVSMVAVEYGRSGDFWRVTEAGARRLFETVFPPGNLEVAAHGNVLAATAFLHGLSCEDVDRAELDAVDPAYPVVVTVRAVKPATSPHTVTGWRRGSAILLYHRVAGRGQDVHGLAVSPDDFRLQMEQLARDWRPLPLAELAAATAHRDVPDGAVAVTFDDGYLDNLEEALPILTTLGIPATFFLTGEVSAAPATFWWDLLEEVFFVPRNLPPRIGLRIDGSWRSFAASDAAARRASHDELYSIIKTSLPAVRDDLLRQLSRTSGVAMTLPDHRRITAGEIGRLAASPLVEIGAHGLHHLSLGALPPEQVFREVFESRTALERVLDRAVSSFAYPYGDAPAGVIEVVRAADYRTAVTCEPRPLRPREDPLGLPRLEAPTRDGRGMSEWLRAACAAWRQAE